MFSSSENAFGQVSFMDEKAVAGPIAISAEGDALFFVMCGDHDRKRDPF